ncbi:hypothetical protein H7F50_18775 [Novosphingobium flavum]|uniref:hypothetical protein n=1 Tax=Novosphingobium aerophilum TaxID=2839843 RepID=UPI00163A6BEE|nr:hypothetical protein [Novosphingobium aerophilum]MBC2663765.1 hypothetical protein [Novosphingobium aerophilum]
MVKSNTQPTIYYLPGRGGRLDEGLGSALNSRGYQVCGRQTLGEFQRLTFSDQIQAIANDLLSEFWNEDSLVIANSYGAYLFLHAQTVMPLFPGRVLLLSPVLGGSSAPGGGLTFMPPFADRLLELARSGELKVPARCEMHVGEHDWQCQPERVAEFGALLGVPVAIAPNGGHQLEKPYVSRLLDDWLPAMPPSFAISM